VTDEDPLADERRNDDDAARELDCLMMIGTIAGRVAHEINNPLASIQNAFLLIKDAIPSTHPHYNYVAAIEREIQRIAAVTRRLSESYRPEHDRAIGVAVSAIVGDAARLALQGLADDPTRLQLNNRVHAAYAAPAGLLRHVLHEVFGAALRSSPSDHPVLVNVSVDDHILWIRVRYRGDQSSVAFEPGRYPDRLIAALRGAIDVRETGPGQNELTLQVPMIVRSDATP
jgi:signal transduction histidine kinase